MSAVARSTYRRLIAVAVVLLGTAAAFLSATNVFPDCTYAIYSEARRLIKAAAPLEKLPREKPKPHEVPPCPGVPPTMQTISPGQYFPLGVLGCGERTDQFLISWYSNHLKALGEPSLFALSRSDPRAKVYRFLWLRTFNHPVSVRLVIDHDLTGVLIVKIANGAGGYAPGALIRNERIPIGKHGPTLLLTRLSETNFWALPRRTSPGGFDGAQWIVEGVTDGRYQLVDRWTPGEGDPIHTLGMTFLADLAGLRIDPKEIY